MTHAHAEKAALGKAIQERLERLSEQDKNEEGRVLSRRVRELLPPPPCNICAFIPLQDEVKIHALLRELLRDGYALYLPMFENGLVFRKTETIDGLSAGAFGIPEPPVSAPKLEDATEAIVLVPGRAFSKTGERMGRGNGGYDRWIRAKRNASPATSYWGICHECQVVDRVPMEAHDERVDRVITSRGIAA